jgi:two-component system, NarL family, response regulator DevR
VRVFLLDDHEIVRDGLRTLIDATDDLVVVGEAASCAEARARIPEVAPDVAVLDVRLPDGRGIDVCRELATSAPSVRSLMLTSYDDQQAMLDAAGAGAAAFVVKQIRGNGLLDSIRQVAAGRSLVGSRGAPAPAPRSVPQVDPRLAALTPRQRKVLDLLANGLTNRQIAAELSLSEKTVKNTVSAILLALGVRRRVEAAVVATQLREPEAC